MAIKKSETAQDWNPAANACLTTALARLEELARDSADAKTLESIVKTVADVVGAGLYLARGQQRPGAQTGGDDD